ncbi:MAG: hypothetical protein HC772_18915 [Leptolyngbyaceae cyanobacterium CRU_2_3]|nr:hypothetical protein [Leptolyngbyaceae cyanobacterium CRU_2_3]
MGRGDCWGDGVTPIEAAHLEGAEKPHFGERHAFPSIRQTLVWLPRTLKNLGSLLGMRPLASVAS